MPGHKFKFLSMVDLGKYNTLILKRLVEFGAYLDGEELGEILLPSGYLPDGSVPDDLIDVFVYCDSEDRLVATTEKPYAQAGEFAFLEVKDTGKFGAFLDWGLKKDVLVPHRDQKQNMDIGRKYLVYIYVDNISNRIVASAKVDKFLDNVPPEYTSGDEVDILIAQETDIGYKAIINNLHWGILYKNEVFRTLKPGDRLKAYVRKVREDEKIDLTLDKDGYDKIDEVSKTILSILKEKNGYLEVNDNSKPDEIYALFRISKKNFKKAIGNLYRRKKIEITGTGIKLTGSDT